MAMKILVAILKNPFLAVLIVGFFSSIFLYVFRDSSFPLYFIITIVAWIASDMSMSLFVGGGRGIGQIPIHSSRSQFKGIVFVTFFIAIFMVAVFVNFLATMLTDLLSSFLTNFYVCLATGFVIAMLVFLDLQIKIYTRGRSR